MFMKINMKTLIMKNHGDFNGRGILSEKCDANVLKTNKYSPTNIRHNKTYHDLSRNL